VYSASHGQAGTSMKNIQSTLRTVSGLYKNFSLTVLFGSNSNSYTFSTQEIQELANGTEQAI
jgi:hypothetical protein